MRIFNSPPQVGSFSSGAPGRRAFSAEHPSAVIPRGTKRRRIQYTNTPCKTQIFSTEFRKNSVIIYIFLRHSGRFGNNREKRKETRGKTRKHLPKKDYRQREQNPGTIRKRRVRIFHTNTPLFIPVRHAPLKGAQHIALVSGAGYIFPRFILFTVGPHHLVAAKSVTLGIP